MATALINGINYSSVNIQCIIMGVPIVGITKISYKRKQDKKNNYALGKRPPSRGYGIEEYEASMDIYLEEWKRIVASAPNRNPLEIPPFDITVILAGTGVAVDKDILRMVDILEDPFEASEGDTRLTVTVPLLPGDIER